MSHPTIRAVSVRDVVAVVALAFFAIVLPVALVLLEGCEETAPAVIGGGT